MKKIFLLLAVFLMSLGSSMTVSAQSWPPANEGVPVIEWVANMHYVDVGKTYFFKGVFYRCTGVTEAWGEYSWSPPVLVSSGKYEVVGEGKLWTSCMGTINQGDYILYGDIADGKLHINPYLPESHFYGHLYQCTVETNSATWIPGNFQQICNAYIGVVPDPCNVDVLPDNYVGYFYNGVISFLPGYVGIVVEGEKADLVYECIAKTSVANDYGQEPGGALGYWWKEGPNWDSPSISLGNVKDLLSIDLPASGKTVTIPAWDDIRTWPMGAIVEHEGKYYNFVWNASNKYTAKGTGQEPGTEAGFGIWGEIELNDPVTDDVIQINANQLNYFVQNGYLVVNSSEQVSIQLYNLTGQIVATAAGKSIELPQDGVYIAKINAGGKVTTVKIFK